MAAVITDAPFRIVAATADDAGTILRMIRGLAEFERLTDRVTATETTLRQQLFGERPAAEACLAFVADEAIGFAVFHGTFSTFAGRPGIYLEDLYVEPQWRGHGYGRQLFEHVARVGAARGCHAMSWAVLPWNERAISFYRRLGAEKMTEWETFRLAGDAFDRIVGGRS